MTIINTSPDRIIQLGYEGEDRVTVLRFRYGADWLENGEGVFHIRVRRHGEHTAYNAQLVTEDPEYNCLLMTVTNVELSVKGSGEMQVVYSGADFVKKSPIYSYNVSRAVDEAVDPPAQDVYTEIIESLSELQTDIRQIDSDVSDLSELTAEKIGDMTELTTEDKISLVSAINEVNSKSVDDVLSATSTNPVQNKVLTARINSLDSDVGTLRTSVQSKADIQTVSALADAVNGLDSDVQDLQTAVQSKADIQTVSALADAVNGLDSDVQDLQTAVQSKADAQTVTALSGTVTGLQTSKADKTYVDVQLDGKASTQTVSDLVDDVYDIYPTDTASGVIANFPDGANSVPVKSLTVAIEPVQDLHGYDSPWPAGGGANKVPLFESKTVNGVTLTNNNGEITLNGTATADAYFDVDVNILIPNGSTYYLCCFNPVATDSRVSLFAITDNGNPQKNMNVVNGMTTTTATADATISKFRLRAPIGVTLTNFKCSPMLQIGGTAPTVFSPYSNICPITGWTGAKVTVSPTTDEEDGTTYDITFPSEAGTVYGGTLDVTNGVLTVDRAMVDLGTLNWNYTSQFDCYFSYLTRINGQQEAKILFDAICSNYPFVGRYQLLVDKSCSYIYNQAIAVRDSAYADVATFKTDMSGVQLVYELADPIIYQLTPQEVSTLLGQNNIWADTGDTSVTYRADTKLYIDNKITQAIAAALNA